MTNSSLPIKPVIAFLIVMDFSVATLPCPPPLLGDRRIILFCRYTVYGIWWWFWVNNIWSVKSLKKGGLRFLMVEKLKMPFSASNTGSWIIARYALPHISISILVISFDSSQVVFFSSFSHFCEYCERVGAGQKAEHSRIPRISCWIHQLFCWDNTKHLFRRRFKNTTHGLKRFFSFPGTPKKQQLPCNSLNLLVASNFSTFRFPFKVPSKKNSTATTNKNTPKTTNNTHELHPTNN